MEAPPVADQAAYANGLVAWQQGDFETARRCVQQAIHLNGRVPAYYNLLGACCYHQGALEMAVAAYRRALALQDDFADGWSNLCLALGDLGQLDEALEAGLRALQLNPNSADANCNLGNAYARLGRLLEATACYEQSLIRDRNSIHARRNLGHLYKEQGQFDVARRHYEAVLAMNPRDGQTYEKLANIRRATPADLPQCSALEAVLMDRSLPTADRVGMHFALGKMYDDIGDYDRSFQHFQSANGLIREPYEANENERYVTRMIEFFSPTFFSARPGISLQRRQPVFVVGMFRSGSTLVEQILSSHPDAFGAGELMDIPKLVDYLPRLTGGATPYPECLRYVTDAHYQNFAEAYLDRRSDQGAGNKLVVDKMLTNCFSLGLLAVMFPQAKVIHCVRDPRDICLSCFTTNFSARPAYSTDLLDTAHYYRQYHRVMEHWKRVCPLSILEVRYEEVVRDLRGATESVLKFCELPWSDRCLEFHNTNRHVATASDWQVRQPLYSNSVGRWKRYARHLKPLSDSLADLLPSETA